ncbi:MAG TPA: DUF4825 domain-containing protein [Candidatus Eisenbergiella merdigallinarum]|uniref:DUF4825 domain-containing protein n=1 Tax=Candidatus Eisenbergiella merdigallinarum TaxID=2838552 RepID=A0A9D2SCY8_9FIRM|nr:DUF4825 domain-containing protein [Candidatus Eisenbergiella merdigallinarum]
MNRKNKGIVALLAVAVVWFCAIQFWIIPADRAKRADYARNQTDALTHDISAIEDYRSAYVGDASNIGGLFENLPLNDIARKYEIDPDDCTLTVNYLDTVRNIGEEKARRDSVYNSVAAMAAIDNLAGITCNFSDGSYSLKRKEIEDIFGSPLSNLLSPDRWSEEVQERLSSEEFCRQFYQ